ncbi:MAG: DNA polymerase III subunit delta [Humidesulfovibrio sp.]|nr:DNA polymerase III subunit delta [Humidesulfovibrio sp.]
MASPPARPTQAPGRSTRWGHRFLICPDAELLRRQMTKLAAGMGPVDTVARKVFWGDDEPFPQGFWPELTTQNLFSTPTVLVLRRAEMLKAEVWDRLDEGLRLQASTVLPVFCLEGRWKDGKPPVPVFLPKRKLWQTAEERAWVWQSSGLTEATLPKFLDAWAKEKALDLDSQAKRALLDALPHDALAAGLELDKLELAAGDAKRVTADMAELIAPHGDMDFFDFMRGLAARPESDPEAVRGVWARVLDDQLRPSGDKILFQLLGYVAWQARQMWMLCEGEEHKVRMNPRDKPALTRMAKQLGRAGIARIIELTLDANLGVISGARRPDDTLESYVAQLSTLLQPSQPGRPA